MLGLSCENVLFVLLRGACATFNLVNISTHTHAHTRRLPQRLATKVRQLELASACELSLPSLSSSSISRREVGSVLL